MYLIIFCFSSIRHHVAFKELGWYGRLKVRSSYHRPRRSLFHGKKRSRSPQFSLLLSLTTWKKMALNGPHSAIAMIIGIKLPLLFKKLQERSFEDLVSPIEVIYNLYSYFLYLDNIMIYRQLFYFFLNQLLTFLEYIWNFVFLNFLIMGFPCPNVLVLHTCIFTSPRIIVNYCVINWKKKINNVLFYYIKQLIGLLFINVNSSFF